MNGTTERRLTLPIRAAWERVRNIEFDPVTFKQTKSAQVLPLQNTLKCGKAHSLETFTNFQCRGPGFESRGS